jgi:hypothetical protein
LAERGIHLVSTDEKTGIQALERLYPDIPLGPGRVQRREYEYIRHGTLCLTANLEIWCGWIIAPTLGPTRTEADFVAHVEQTVATDPLAGWVFITDNLNTHQSESLVLWVAQTCGIEEDLGKNADFRGAVTCLFRTQLCPVDDAVFAAPGVRGLSANSASCPPFRPPPRLVSFASISRRSR